MDEYILLYLFYFNNFSGTDPDIWAFNVLLIVIIDWVNDSYGSSLSSENPNGCLQDSIV